MNSGSSWWALRATTCAPDLAGPAQSHLGNTVWHTGSMSQPTDLTQAPEISHFWGCGGVNTDQFGKSPRQKVGEWLQGLRRGGLLM